MKTGDAMILYAEREDGVQIFELDNGRFMAIHPELGRMPDRFKPNDAMFDADTAWEKRKAESDAAETITSPRYRRLPSSSSEKK